MSVKESKRNTLDHSKSVSVSRRDRTVTVIVLALSLVIFLVSFFLLRPAKASGPLQGDYSEYEKAKVLSILSDTTEIDPASDDAYRGEQLITAEVKTGQYKGKTMQAYNYVGPLYGTSVKIGDNVVLNISTYASGEVRATVFEYSRALPLLFVILIFVAVTVLVGRGTGARSLIALALTILCLFAMLLPALKKGAPTILTTLAVAVFITVVSLTIIGGINKKTLCAMAGTIAGTVFAALFGLICQTVLRVNGLRMNDVEPLLQIRQTGEAPIGLKGLLIAGVIISAIGAVMDVAMSISSSLSEVKEADPSYGFKELFRSGMNIGRDMVGTMTNTLILAFMGSSFVLIFYLYTLDLSFWQLTSSAFVSLEITSSIACSIGLILAIPLTAAICAFVYSKKEA